MSKKRKEKGVFFRTTEEEREIIERKMEMLGVKDLGQYLRRMAVYGYMVEVDMEPLNSIYSELNHMGNNINQLAKRTNETGNVYYNDIQKIGEDLLEIKGYIRDFTRFINGEL